MLLNENVINELNKYNLLEDVNKIIKEDNIIKVYEEDINSIVSTNIKAYFNDVCNNNADFLIKIVSNEKVSKCLLHIEESGFSIDLVEQSINRIRTTFGEDVDVIFSRKESNDKDIKILFIAC